MISLIWLIGIKHNVPVEIREKLSVIPKHCERVTKQLLEICEEAVVLSTCNRTEVYISAERHDHQFIDEVFNCLGWDLQYKAYVFYASGREAVIHLLDVACGFDSMLLGEDQILGQVRNAYETSLKMKAVSGVLQRLFQTAITCGKDFRCKSEIFKVPVSLASMVVREAIRRGRKRFMVLGFGEVGQLVAKYILEEEFQQLIIAARNPEGVNIPTDKAQVIDRVLVIPFPERKNYYPTVDCIISCTSAPHVVIKAEDLPGNELLIFDMAVPRDVDVRVRNMGNVTLYDTDQIGKLQDENYERRKKIMTENRDIIQRYAEEFEEWCKVKELSPFIQEIKEVGTAVYLQRYRTFLNKKEGKNTEELVEMLLKSTVNVFVNNAIKVLKKEYLEGRGRDCRRILEEIFQK